VRSPRRSGHEEHWVERGTDVERAVFFSDAVFAIAITLLALEIRGPDAPTHLGEALLALWPRFFSFLGLRDHAAGARHLLVPPNRHHGPDGKRRDGKGRGLESTVYVSLLFVAGFVCAMHLLGVRLVPGNS
jgi:hypothetical protein